MQILFAFAPFLTFALLDSRIGTHGALVAATVVSGILVARNKFVKHKSTKLLEVGSLALFGGLALAARLPQFSPSVLTVRLWVDVGILIIVVGSILIGRPFTLQYAQEEVSAEIAATPRFKAVNLKISGAWALAFAVIVAADAAMLYLPGFTPMAGTAVILTALAGAAAATAWLPKAAARRAA